MLRRYTITKGRFVLPDGTTKGPGEPIDLEDDVAEVHGHQIELAPGQAGPSDDDGAGEPAEQLP